MAANQRDDVMMDAERLLPVCLLSLSILIARPGIFLALTPDINCGLRSGTLSLGLGDLRLGQGGLGALRPGLRPASLYLGPAGMARGLGGGGSGPRI